MIFVPGVPYTSKQALARIAELVGSQAPHVTPDGRAILAIFTGGGPLVSINDDVIERKPAPWVFHALAENGSNIEHVVRGPNGQLEVQTAKFPLDAFGDVERLVEYDHLPESRKDYSVYPRGHKLV